MNRTSNSSLYPLIIQIIPYNQRTLIPQRPFKFSNRPPHYNPPDHPEYQPLDKHPNITANNRLEQTPRRNVTLFGPWCTVNISHWGRANAK